MSVDYISKVEHILGQTARTAWTTQLLINAYFGDSIGLILTSGNLYTVLVTV